jgi:hypothetical protein
VEQLEGRTLLSSYSAATVSDLVADINAANAANGSNTITLTAPTTSPYVLTAVDNKADGANGLPVIANHDNLTIIGDADTIERSTASGTSAFRLFDVAKGGSLTLQNLALQNGLAFGSASSAEGGAIYNHGSLVLTGVTVQGNTAQGSNATKAGQNGLDGSGGGVWSGCSLTLENGTVLQNNQAIGGAGTHSTDLVKNGFGGNAFGAGVYVAGGTANITGATIDNNVAVGGNGGSIDPGGVGFPPTAPAGNASGGGVYIAAGTVTLSSDTVDGNQAKGGGVQQNGGSAFGGGICLAAGTVTLSSDTVVGNSATPGAMGYGGLVEGCGIYIGSQATATLCNDTVESNSHGPGPSEGGGIYIASGATVYIDSFTVANTINNTDGSGLNGPTANIDGSYILRNC